MRKSLFKLLFALPLIMVLGSCADDFLAEDYILGEGEAVVSATVDFHPLVTTENDVASRGGAAGDAIANIETLTVFIYNEQGILVDIVNQNEMQSFNVIKKDETGSNTDMPNDAGGKPVQAEETTARATFTIPKISFGRYYMYAVANVEGLEDTEANRERFQRVKSLRDMQVKWSESDIASNNQMFGYFTPTGNDTETSAGFDAPVVTVGAKIVNLHAWIKRAASKVTVVFDGSGLHENIWIYVKNVTIRDIPLYCKIGNENSVHTNSPDSMIAVGDMIEYDKDGILPDGVKQGDQSTDWLSISKGSGLKGAVSIVDGDTITHSEYDRALYFYENMQGNYADAANKKFYDKRQDWDNVGFVPSEGDYDYKDNVKYGTYIEVEAYYNSSNPTNVSQGKIIYRFMLGQNVTYDYNASRNHHYKLTLGFKGYANQPDWHIDYVEPENTIFTDPTYYVSYIYNQRSTFPIRLTGQPTGLEIEIVENNWAPFDPSQGDSVPPAIVKEPGAKDGDFTNFRWNRKVYKNEGKIDVTNATQDYSYNDVASKGYYYGLQKPYSSDGKNQVTYTDELAPKHVTPIWAGFLALQVPDGELQPTIMEEEPYQRDFTKLKTYYYTNKQNIRTFSKNDLSFNGWTAGSPSTKVIGTGNNACEVVKAADGSVTVNMPMWTRPKSFFGISGFTGNNPYDTYQRKAVVKITATFGTKKVVKYMPVFQVRRVVNPKAIWHKWDDNSSFNVTLMRRNGASSKTFDTFESEGAWKAYVKTFSEGADGFISLTGGVGKGSDGAIYGNTNTPVSFTVNFHGQGQKDKSLCAVVEVEYHGFTCRHTIFVRQGYFQPLDIAGDGVRWSSFNLYSCDKDAAFGTSWNASTKNYIGATLTANPLTMGTMFKRGNYNGILISNNETYGLNVAPGQYNTFAMSNGDHLTWQNIQGYPISNSYGGWSMVAFDANTPQATFAWGRFQAVINGETRHYRVPTYDDYNKLALNCEYGIGVIYGDGATEPAINVSDAYGFEDTDNDGNDTGIGTVRASSRGMRGFIVYNPKNAHQIFFPLGARGVGRRTMTGYTATAYGDFGKLRYSQVTDVLSSNQDAMRPIPYNTYANPGAMYWINKPGGPSGPAMCWDMNYADLNFISHSFPVGFTPQYVVDKDANVNKAFNITHGGDALPIKLVLE